MKLTFTRDELMGNSCCYSGEVIAAMQCYIDDDISMLRLLNDTPVEDAAYYLKFCEITDVQMQELADILMEDCPTTNGEGEIDTLLQVTQNEYPHKTVCAFARIATLTGRSENVKAIINTFLYG